MYSRGMVNFIDFGYSGFTEDKSDSNPVSANLKGLRVNTDSCVIYLVSRLGRNTNNRMKKLWINKNI